MITNNLEWFTCWGRDELRRWCKFLNIRDISSTLLAYCDGLSTRTSANSKICSCNSLLRDLSSFLKSTKISSFKKSSSKKILLGGGGGGVGETEEKSIQRTVALNHKRREQGQGGGYRVHYQLFIFPTNCIIIWWNTWANR